MSRQNSVAMIVHKIITLCAILCLLSCEKISKDIKLTDCVVKTISSPLTQQSPVKVVSWNVGHFSSGEIPYSTISMSSFHDMQDKYHKLITGLDADLFGVNEYSVTFCKHNQYKSCHLWEPYSTSAEGIQRNYSCNALFSKLETRNVHIERYESNSKLPITHTTNITSQDYYYICAEVVIDSIEVTVVVTHLAFDLNNPTLETSQIAELVNKYKDQSYVILMGDWNVAFGTHEWDVFTEYGFTMANHSSNSDMRTFSGNVNNPCLDNIIVKGFSISNVEVHNTNLSDHYPISCELEIILP